MTTDELTNRYTELYNQMAASNEPRNMKLFGSVMNDMMAWTIHNQPSIAEGWIDKLCAMNWEQYLSKAEATTIVDALRPEYAWDFDTWQKALNTLGLETERKGVFNEYALWAWMNAVYSDQAQVLAKHVFAEPLADVPAEKIVPLIHALAVSNLTDKDNFFKIRDYFLV